MARKKPSRQRRRRGEGSFFIRKDGRHAWEGKILGESHTVYGTSYDDVSAKVAELKSDALNGVVPAAKGTLAEFLTEWLVTVRRNLRPKTYSSYECTIRVHIIPPIGAIALAKLQPVDIERALQRVEETPRTCAYVLVVLRRSLGDAVKWERVRRNVANVVSMPKYEKPTIHPYEDDEFDRWLAALEGHAYRAMFLCGATLGLRKGEVTGLSWPNVSFTTNAKGEELVQVKITQQVQRVSFDERGQRVTGSDSLQILPVKTKKSRRMLTGGPELAAAMKEMRRLQLEWRMRAGSAWNNPHDLVFTMPNGRMLDPRHALRMHYKIIKQAGTRDDVTFHGLRHQAATDMVAAGMDIHKVSQVLGHSTIRVTSDTYVEPRMTADDVAVLDRNAKRRG